MSNSKTFEERLGIDENNSLRVFEQFYLRSIENMYSELEEYIGNKHFQEMGTALRKIAEEKLPIDSIEHMNSLFKKLVQAESSKEGGIRFLYYILVEPFTIFELEEESKEKVSKIKTREE